MKKTDFLFIATKKLPPRKWDGRVYLLMLFFSDAPKISFVGLRPTHFFATQILYAKKLPPHKWDGRVLFA